MDINDTIKTAAGLIMQLHNYYMAMEIARVRIYISRHAA